MTPGTAPAAALPAANPTPLDAALAGLADSRARLRAELSPPLDAGPGRVDGQGRPQAGRWPQSLGALWRRGRRALQAWPVADLAAGLLQDWWQHHPWRNTSEELAEAARLAVLPLVRRHPLRALLGAAAIGALLVAARAWRWPPLRPARPPAARGAGHWLAAQLAKPAVQTALLSALMLLVKQWSERGAAAAAPMPSPVPSPTPSPVPSPMPSPMPPPPPRPAVPEPPG